MTETDFLDIHSKKEGAAGILSNFYPHAFLFEGVRCASMEGLLQALKFEDLVEQAKVCALWGEAAKNKGMTRDEAWKAAQTLWWKGRAYAREGAAYQHFLDAAYDALYAQNEAFRTALASTGNTPLRHSLGKSDPRDTILTQQEFCSRLERVRAVFN